MANINREPNARVSDASKAFWLNNAHIFRDMVSLFGTDDPRHLFGNNCFLRGSLAKQQEFLVGKYRREKEDGRGIVVNNLVELLSSDHMRSQYATYIGECGYETPSRCLADEVSKQRARSCSQHRVNERKAQCSNQAAAQHIGSETIPPPTSIPMPKPAKTASTDLPDLTGQKPLRIPAKGQDTWSKAGCGNSINYPLYFGDVKQTSLAVSMANPYKRKNKEEHPTGLDANGDPYPCPRCGEEHNAIYCPDGGTIRFKKDEFGRKTDVLEFIGQYYKCFVCGQREGGGHWSATCPWRHPDWQPNQCFNCATFGHRISACPHPRRNPNNTDKVLLPTWEMRKKGDGGQVKKIAAQFPTFREAQRRARMQQRPQARLFVGNLTHGTREADIGNLFRSYEVESIQLHMGEGYAFVNLYYKEQAESAKRWLNGKFLMGSNVVVNDAFEPHH